MQETESTTIYLVRHGQTESNVKGFLMGWSDEDLDNTGLEQVQLLSSRLAGLPISGIYSSPLQRTRRTATALAQPHYLEPKVIDDLIEINQGEWQGLHRSDIERGWPEIWKKWRTDPSEIAIPKGESLKQVAERAVRAFKGVVEDSRGTQAVIVSHEIVIKLIVIHILGAPYNIYRRFDIDRASLTTVLAGPFSRVVAVNDTCHLAGQSQAR